MLIALLGIVVVKSFAQSYHNEWIDYSKTYYKFKVGPSFGLDDAGWPIKKGVVRITQPALAAAGLGSIPAEQLQLLRNGQEIPVYISRSTGVLSSSDYIEFWGEIEDGKPDKDLYRDSAFQLSTHWSLETDSSAYFFTTNTAGGNKRLTNVTNNASSATIVPEKNFMHTVGRYYRSQLTQGFSVLTSEGISLSSSSYDQGEGFASRLIYPGSPIPWTHSGLFIDTLGAPATANFVTLGAALNSRNIIVYLNNDSLVQYQMNYFSPAILSVPGISPHLLANDVASFQFKDLSTDPNDNFVVVQAELNYPRKFNLGGDSSFEFTLPASDTGRYIKITNFSTNGVTPVLYDIANGTRYLADISVADTLRFLLQPSTQQYQLALVRGDGSSATYITSFQARKFTDFTVTANQGNYLIITNPVLYGTGGSNYIEQYRAYRSSVKGGGFNAKIVDIHDLEDQFAYGVSRHPLAIKNFLSFAENKFNTPPGFVFLVGKGIQYGAYRLNETDPLVSQTALVPTFGSPGSDNLLGSNNYNPVPAIAIGRLSVISPQEAGIYLTKIKEYESAQHDTVQTAASKGWMKNVLQLTGVNDPTIGAQLDGYMANYKSIISDTLFGGNVTTYSKSADPGTYPTEVVNFTNTFNQGSSIVNYFGHSSSTELDFSLNDPSQLNNTGKYPLFIVNGCLAGNIFDYDAGRTTNLSTISEKFILQPEKGAIGYLSSSSYGEISYLDIYTTQFYKSIGMRKYGQSFGSVMQDALSAGLNVTGYSDFFGRIHAEQLTFHGDPALTVNSFNKPDYYIDTTGITVSPSFVSVADDSFSVKVVILNLGKATNDSVHFSLFRKLPNGDSLKVFSKEFASLKISDSVTVKLPVIADRDNGLVKVTAYIDDDNKIAEVSETNNIATKSIIVSSAEIRPVYPFNYSIVTTDKVTLAASTANPLDTLKKYVMQMDTTALFNSPALTSQNISSSGGVIEYKNVALPLNNTVYYWRVAPSGKDPHWNMFSFTHRSGGNAGFEQGHFYQFAQSSFNNLLLDSATRSLRYGKTLANMFIKQGIYGYSAGIDADFSVAINGTFVAESACVGQSIIFNVFDPLTLKIYTNTSNPYGAAPTCDSSRANNFEFSVTDPNSRNNAASFLKNFVHDGDYVVARSIDIGDYAPVWAADSTYFGSKNTLYQLLKDQGIAIDNYDFQRCYIFLFKKNDSTHFSPISLFSNGLYDAISLSENISVSDTLGYLTSPTFGPGKKWSKVNWTGIDSNSNNLTSMNVIGINRSNQDTVLFKLDKTQHTQDISSVNASTYPNIMLQMRTQDSLTAQPYQLKDWSVEYTPVAEGAIAPNIGVNLPDTVKFKEDVNKAADTLQGYVVFKNVSISDFDSLKVRLLLYDSNNVAHAYPVQRTKILVAGDTAKVGFITNITSLPQGNYNLFLMINADNDQPEQYLFNNSLYKYIYVLRSNVVPVHLLSFTGQPDAKGVLLNWKVENELNFSYYGVEYSTDGRQFSQVGSVAAKGAAGYSFLHTNPVIGNNYYRLKLVDKDGLYNYSQVIDINFGESVIKVYPNPFSSSLNISLNTNINGKNIIRVLDLGGKQLMEKTFAGGNITLDVSNLASGTYLVQVNNGVTVKSFKVQKQDK